VKLDPKARQRLRKNWGPLSEMHLLLGEYGCEPKWERSICLWTHPSYPKIYISTMIREFPVDPNFLGPGWSFPQGVHV